MDLLPGPDEDAAVARIRPFVAAQLGLDPRPFAIAIILGASAGFATPIGYQTNTFVYSAGGYRFGDFFRIGLPLNLLYLVGALVIIPWVWPLHR